MKALWDNDIIWKLCATGLTEEAKQVLQVDGVVVLSTARYVLCPTNAKKRKRAEKRYGAEVMVKIEDFLQTCEEADLSPDRTSGLEGIEDLDAGELILFRIAADAADDLMVTGDKRCIRAMHQAAEDRIGDSVAIVESLSNRVVCLEQIFRGIVQSFGAALVHDRVEAGVDKTLDMVVRENEAETIAGLESYIRTLRQETGTLLRSFG